MIGRLLSAGWLLVSFGIGAAAPDDPVPWIFAGIMLLLAVIAVTFWPTKEGRRPSS